MGTGVSQVRSIPPSGLEVSLPYDTSISPLSRGVARVIGTLYFVAR